MARKTTRERREQAEALQRAVEQSRRQWLGKRVRFRHLLDKKMKVGVFTAVDDQGHVTLTYQMCPWWPDEPAGAWCTSVGHEQELLDLLEGKVIEDECDRDMASHLREVR